MPKVLFPNDDQYKWQGKEGEAVFGSGFSVPSGIEALLQYNGLVMNDREVLDKYRVTSIEGVDDADIRDSREDKPQDDGEDSYGNLYSGRTIVINLTVEAYSLDKLRDMEEALRTAFAEMKERPLYFVTGDPLKDHYITCKKSQKLQKAEGVKEYEGRFFRDWNITLRASDFRFLRNRKKYLASFANIVNGDLNPSSGFSTSALSSAYSLNRNFYTSGWVGSSSISGGKLVAYNFSELLLGTTITNKIKPNVDYDVSMKLSWVRDNLLFTWGTGLFFGVFTDASDNILQNTNQSMGGGLGQFGVTDRVVNTTFKAPNNPLVSKMKIFAYFNVTSANKATDTLSIDDFKISLSDVHIDSAQVSVVNEGNWNSLPLVRVYGGMGHVEILNQDTEYPWNNIKLKDSVTIGNNDVYTFDIKNRTIVNAAGQNKINDLDKNSGWLKLQPGNNRIQLGDDVTFGGGTPQLEIEYRDSWV